MPSRLDAERRRRTLTPEQEAEVERRRQWIISQRRPNEHMPPIEQP